MMIAFVSCLFVVVSFGLDESLEAKIDLWAQGEVLNLPVDGHGGISPESCIVYGNNYDCAILEPEYEWIDVPYDEVLGYTPEVSRAKLHWAEGMGWWNRDEIYDSDAGATWRVLHPCTLLDYEANTVDLDKWELGSDPHWAIVDKAKLFSAINSTGWLIASYKKHGIFPAFHNFGSLFYIRDRGEFFTARHVLKDEISGYALSGYSGSMRSVLYDVKLCSKSFQMSAFHYYSHLLGFSGATDIGIAREKDEYCSADDIVVGRMKYNEGDAYRFDSSLQIVKDTSLCDVGAIVLVIGHPTKPNRGVILSDESYLSPQEAKSIMYSGDVIVSMGEILAIDLEYNIVHHSCLTIGGMSGSSIVSAIDPTIVCGMHYGTSGRDGRGTNIGYYYKHPAMQRFAV